MPDFRQEEGMEILFVNRHYGSDPVPTGRMLRDVVLELSRRGHRIRVLTSKSDYAATVRQEKSLPENVQLSLLWTPGERLRGASWVALWLQACWKAPWMRWDRCVILTDPPFMVLAAWLTNRFRRRKRPVYWWTMDLYPECLVGYGLLKKGGWLHWALRYVSEMGARHLAGTVTLGQCQVERLSQYRGWPDEEDQVIVVPPWDYRPIARVAPVANRFVKKYHLQDKKIILYAGNLGAAHSFEPVVEAARERAQRGEDQWRFVFVVRGVRRGALEEAAKELDNVIVTDYQPPEWTPDLLWSADVHLITLRDQWEGVVVPSKLYGILQTEAPVLFIGPEKADTAEEICRHEAGLVLDAGAGGKEVVKALNELMQPRWRKHKEINREGPKRIADFLTRELPEEKG